MSDRHQKYKMADRPAHRYPSMQQVPFFFIGH